MNLDHKNIRILVVDDETDIRQVVGDVLQDEHYQVQLASNAEEAKRALGDTEFDVILLDIWMPEQDGISLLQEWSEGGQLEITQVIMMSGHGTVETAMKAVRLGAYDFVEKPLSIDTLFLAVDRASKDVALRRENQKLRERLLPKGELIGNGHVMSNLRQQISALGATDSWALISGEPGSGKGQVARYIHRHSAREDQPLVELNLAATPKENIAIQLFGYEENGKVFQGKIEQANNGTLVLDEIGDLDLDTQTKLLRALDERQLLRIGGKEYVNIDVRVLATTNQDLDAKVSAGEFREDLYYRLNVVPIYVPPLRKRTEDIPELANHFLKRLQSENEAAAPKITADAMQLMRHYPWPGNVRELENFIQRLAIFYPNKEVGANEVTNSLGNIAGPGGENGGNILYDLPIREARDQFEKAYLEHHMTAARGNVSEVARQAGLERTHLYRKLKALDIDPKLGKRS